MVMNKNSMFSHHHPREGGGLASAKRIYKGRLTATDWIPAFAGMAGVCEC